MKKIILVLLILVAFTAASAQTQTRPPNTASGLESEMKAITREMHDLLGRGEKEKLLSYFADDFVGTSYDGTTITKEDLVQNFTTRLGKQRSVGTSRTSRRAATQSQRWLIIA